MKRKTLRAIVAYFLGWIPFLLLALIGKLNSQQVLKPVIDYSYFLSLLIITPLIPTMLIYLLSQRYKDKYEQNYLIYSAAIYIPVYIISIYLVLFLLEIPDLFL